MHTVAPPCAAIALLAVTLQAAPLTQGPTEWTACPADFPAALRCTTITVPLDYNKETCEQTLDLMLVKLPARDSAERKGSLVWELGGPGVATSHNALIPAAQSEELLFGDLQRQFDMVAAEPRGVGVNHPVTCDALGNDTFSYFPKTKGEYEDTLSQFEAFGASCLEQTGDVMRYMDTLTQARDLEAVRLAIGEGLLNYYGLSWGTLRGFQYATEYPDNVGLMVLDGIVDHSSSITTLRASQTYSMSATMRRMLDWMRENSTSVLFERDTIKIWRELIERADQQPLPAPECAKSGGCISKVSGNDIRTAILESIAHPNIRWANAAVLIREAFDDNNATGFSYPLSKQRTGSFNSQLPIACQDWEFQESWEDYKLFQYMAGIYSADPAGAFGARIWSLGCPRWPVGGRNPPRKDRVENARSSKPILLVHALLDPNTGYDQALGVHESIDNSVLVTRYGEGHGSLEWPEGFRVIADYYVNGTVPGSTALVDRPMNEDAVTDFEVMGFHN